MEIQIFKAHIRKNADRGSSAAWPAVLTLGGGVGSQNLQVTLWSTAVFSQIKSFSIWNDSVALPWSKPSPLEHVGYFFSS